MWRRRQVSDRIRVSAPQVSPQMSMTGASFLLEQSETIIWKRRGGRRPRLQSSKSSREPRLSRMEHDTWRMPSGPCKRTTMPTHEWAFSELGWVRLLSPAHSAPLSPSLAHAEHINAITQIHALSDTGAHRGRNAVLKKARVGREPELRGIEREVEAAETAHVRQQGAAALREAHDLVTGLSCVRACVRRAPQPWILFTLENADSLSSPARAKGFGV